MGVEPGMRLVLLVKAVSEGETIGGEAFDAALAINLMDKLEIRT